MVKLRVISDILNSVTGTSKRHNRALHDVEDWIITVQSFLNTYDTYGSRTFDALIENIGKAKIDLTAIYYKSRFLVNKAKNIKDKQVLPLIEEITKNVGNLRRSLGNPLLQDTLTEAILGLRTSFEKLRDALSDIEYK